MDLFVSQQAPGNYRVSHGEGSCELVWLDEDASGSARISLDGVQRCLAYCCPNRGEVALQLSGHAAVMVDRLAFTRGDEAREGSGSVTAPMHGNVLEVMVAVGDSVREGDGLAVMEAMKMEHRLVADVTGKVIAVHASPGQQVAAGAVLLEIEGEG